MDKPPVSGSVVSLARCLDALGARHVPVPFEIGAFIALEISEAVLAQPCVIGVDRVQLHADGTSSLVPGPSAADDRCARALLEVLARLLAAAEPGVPPPLVELVERSGTAEPLTLASVHDELMGLLVPINRGAARRVVARLVREAQREGARASEDQGFALSADALDASFDRLMDGLPDVGSADAGSADADSGNIGKEAASVEPAPTGAPVRGAGGRGRRVAVALAVSGVTLLTGAALGLGYERAGAPAVPGWARVPAGWLAEVLQRPGFRATLGSRDPGPAAAATERIAESATPRRPAELRTALEPPRPERGSLRVHSWPSRAQVLRLVGQGQDVELHVPRGLAQELVVMAPGHRAERVVIAGDADWQPCGEHVCRDVRVELEPAKAGQAQKRVALGPSRLPLRPGTASGESGRVRVRTGHAKARVFQLLGVTPYAQLDGLDTRQPVDLMLFLGGHGLSEVRVQPADWHERKGALFAEIDVRLTAARARDGS